MVSEGSVNIWLFKIITDDKGEDVEAVSFELLLEKRTHGNAIVGKEVTYWEEVSEAP